MNLTINDYDITYDDNVREPDFLKALYKRHETVYTTIYLTTDTIKLYDRLKMYLDEDTNTMYLTMENANVIFRDPYGELDHVNDDCINYLAHEAENILNGALITPRHK